VEVMVFSKTSLKIIPTTGAESDDTRDTKLLALSVLISSVFMMNTKGAIDDTQFSKLSLVRRILIQEYYGELRILTLLLNILHFKQHLQ
jgi:hypothetical protein